MEYKDTIMTHKQKKELIIERSHMQTIGETQEDYLLEKQAELSFKEGYESGYRDGAFDNR